MISRVLVTSSLVLLSSVHASNVPQLSARQSVPATLPGSWTSQGCYTDSVGARTLSGAQYANDTAMTVESCIAFCAAQTYVYAGVEFARECYCSNQLGGSAAKAAAGDCTMACTGDPTELCGGPARLNLFLNGQTPPPAPTAKTPVGQWTSLGCYTDAAGARTLTTAQRVDGPVNVEKCTLACQQGAYALAGVEFGSECYCGNSFSNGGTAVDSGCSTACDGDPSELCGGPDRLNVYKAANGTITRSDDNNNNGDTNWKPEGCYTDTVNARTLANRVPVNGLFTAKACTDACGNLNYPLAGVEFGKECYCGFQLDNGARPAASGCDQPCAGDSKRTCGGADRLFVYSDKKYEAPSAPPTIGFWKSLGCYTDNVASRTLAARATFAGSLTADKCVFACQQGGYRLAGMEFANECYCGAKFDNGGAPAASGCDMACAGDDEQLCGGANRLNVYNYTRSLP